jgi:uncharacterized membrane protein YfcA
VSTVSRFRKFLPQVAYVLLAGWTLIADRLDGGHGIDGVTVLAVLVAIAQALAVVIPRSPDVKAGASLITAIAQGVTAAWSDHVITPAEYAVLVSAFLAWAAGAAVLNHPPDGHLDDLAADGPKHLE